MEHEIYRMNLHDQIEKPNMNILRVDGGWIYSFWSVEKNVFNRSVFVPISKEFYSKKKKSGTKKQSTLQSELWPTFDDFWNHYNKKVGKKTKIKSKWDQLNHNTKLKIMDHVEKYKKSQPEKQYRKNPETYINNESWNDEIINSNKNGNKNRVIEKSDADLRTDASNAVDRLFNKQ